MLTSPTALKVLGLSLEGATLYAALILERDGIVVVENLERIDTVKPLDQKELGADDDTLIASSLPIETTLIRPLTLPVSTPSKIASIVLFQAEPLLPYPLDEALIDWQLLELQEEQSKLSLFSVRKEHMQQQLDALAAYDVDPEGVTSQASALAAYAHHVAPTEKLRLIVHVGTENSTALLADGTKVIAAHAIPCGADATDLKQRTQLAITSLKKGTKKEIEKNAVVTGQAKAIALPATKAPDAEYAVAIGTALAFHDGAKNPINLRRGELSYPSPFRRYKKPALTFLALSLILTLTIFLAGNSWLDRKEHSLKSNYYALLVALNKTPDQVDQEYQRNGEENTEELSAENIELRAAFLEEELRSRADTFPLQPNLPGVADLLAWLATHEEILEDGKPSIKLQSLSYTMTRRPEANNKRQRHQVRVEFEFTSETPRHAREFHDALIAPNSFIDGRNDIKWSSSQGRYKAVFFLKDRTAYLSRGSTEANHVA